MSHKPLGIALTVVGIIALTMLLYAQHILENPIDLVWWLVPIICIFMGFIFLVVVGTYQKITPHTLLARKHAFGGKRKSDS